MLLLSEESSLGARVRFRCDTNPGPTYSDRGICTLSTQLRLTSSYTVLEFLNNLGGARNRVGIGLSYRSARLHSLAELVPWNRFLDSLKVHYLRTTNEDSSHMCLVTEKF